MILFFDRQSLDIMRDGMDLGQFVDRCENDWWLEGYITNQPIIVQRIVARAAIVGFVE